MRFVTVLLMIGLCLFVCVPIARAGFNSGDFELTLQATGTSPANTGTFIAGGGIGVGYFLTDDLELGVQQTASYSDTGDATLIATTTGSADINIGLDSNLILFAGAFGGATYGDIETSWIVGPEAGVKVFVADSTLIAFTVRYGIPVDNGSFDDGDFAYNLGLSWRF